MMQPHPLLLPHIISNVLQHFNTPTDLEHLRLVCHTWNEEACDVLRHAKIVEFKNDISLQSYTAIFQDNFDILGTFPHTQFKLLYRMSERKSQSYQNDENLPASVETFVSNFGEFVTSIDVSIGSGYYSSQQLSFILSKLPSVQILGIYFHYYDCQPVCCEWSQEAMLHLNNVHTLVIQVEGLEISEESISDMLTMMFPYLTNLRKIHFPGDYRRISKVGLFLRDVILDSEASSFLQRLCDWSFKTRLLEEDALKLLCKDFAMKSLNIDLYNPDNDNDCISSDLTSGLLLKWGESLENLAIEFPYRKEVSFHFNFPITMQNITVLYLGGFEGILLDLLKFLPRLCRLELSQLELMSVVAKPDANDVYCNVKQLNLDFCTGQTAGILSRLSRMFPLLQTLNINRTTNEVARMVFQKMTNLVHLTMHGNDLSDAGMCGFSESTVKEKTLLTCSPIQGSHFRKYNYIADLTELQYLNLDAYALTEITVRHGLVHCTSLRLVKMNCTGSREDSTLTTIRRTFRLSEYGYHLVEDGRHALIEMKEEPPMEAEALEFFESHDQYSEDVL